MTFQIKQKQPGPYIAVLDYSSDSVYVSTDKYYPSLGTLIYRCILLCLAFAVFLL